MEESLIKRTKRTNNFTNIGNDILTRQDMSFGAKGLLCYILSLPDDFVVYKSKLQKDFNLGRKMVNSLFLEIERCGYMHSVDQIRENGRFGAKHYFFYDISTNPTDVLSATAVSASSVKVPLQRTNTKKETTKQKEQELSKNKNFLSSYFSSIKKQPAIDRKNKFAWAVAGAVGANFTHYENSRKIAIKFINHYTHPANHDKELMRFEEIVKWNLIERLDKFFSEEKTGEDFHEEYTSR